MKSIHIKIITSIIIVAVFSQAAWPFFVPKRAEAAGADCWAGFIAGLASAMPPKLVAAFTNVPNAETGNAVGQVVSQSQQWTWTFKECIFKPLAIMLAKAAIRSIGSSIVNWINTGFKGAPTFVTDPGAMLFDITDRVLGDFIAGTPLGFLCSPFQIDIRIALARLHRPYEEKNNCRLSGIEKNVEGFLAGNNSGTDWNTWLQSTTQPQYNVYGSYLEAQSELSIRILGAQGVEMKQWDWGTGFLSSKKCYDTGEYYDNGSGSHEFTGIKVTSTSSKSRASGSETCEIMTPGTAIANKLHSVLGQPEIEMAVAVELDQILGALANQLVNKIITIGLSAVSRPQANGPSFISTYNAQTLTGNMNNIKNQSGGYLSEFNAHIGNANERLDTDLETTNNLVINNSLIRNVLRGKTARMSSVSGGHTANLAVDGNTNGKLTNHSPTIAITNPEPSPWLRVDIGESTIIKDITVWRRTDHSAEKTLGKFTVSILDANDATIWKSDIINTLDSDSVSHKINNVNKTGTHILIQRERDSYQTNCRSITQYDSTQRANVTKTVCDTAYYQLQLAEIEATGERFNARFEPAFNSVNLITTDTFRKTSKIVANGPSVDRNYKLSAALARDTDETIPWNEVFSDLSFEIRNSSTTAFQKIGTFQLSDVGATLLTELGFTQGASQEIAISGKKRSSRNSVSESDNFTNYVLFIRLHDATGKIISNHRMSLIVPDEN